ncbi:MAG TPA: YihY/virulence factor BrkB family protein [Edaphocola sp.]|nr:YihY/virulence factor BrkB family protein [Edaphocola sp.]
MKLKPLINKFKSHLSVFIKAGSEFADDRATKMSASLAYTTIFSLPPMLLLIIIAGGTFLGDQAVSGKLFIQLREFLGVETALQIQDAISKINFQKNSTMATVISSVILVVGATGIFVEIQDSLNMIWGVKARAKKGFIKLLLSRLLSFTMILVIGFLLMVSLILNTIILTLSSFIVAKFPFIPVDFIDLINSLFSLVVMLTLFTLLFKMLPDVIIKWKQVIPGALVTTLLFILGKYLIGLYIGSSTISTLYGAAGSLIVLLLWIYYSSFILYYGAEYTKAYLDEFGKGKILPNSYSEFANKEIIQDYLDKTEENKDKEEAKKI